MQNEQEKEIQELDRRHLELLSLKYSIQPKLLLENIEKLLKEIEGTLKSIKNARQRQQLEYYQRYWNLFVEQATNDDQETINSKEILKSDWGDAPAVDIFFGRTDELATLAKWINEDRCRLIAILGIGGIGKTQLSVKLGKGGIGKTDLSLKLARNIKDRFEYVIWRSLLSAPPVEEILADWLKFLSNHQVTNLPSTIDDQISQLLYYLREHRCLLLLDNVETILQTHDFAGRYRKEYEGYGQLFKKIGEIEHQSCLLLTSREKPQELEILVGKTRPVRFLELGGLDYIHGTQIFKEISEFEGSDDNWRELVEFYNGNPLALKLAANHIKEVFFGNIAKFLAEGKQVFGDLRELLDWHFERLSECEKDIMYWLAISREPVSIEKLKEYILPQSTLKNQVSDTIQSLQRRITLEISSQRFKLQPVLIEYIIERFIEQVCQEIATKKLALFNNHALILATADYYVRKEQTRLILKPILDRLLCHFGNEIKLEKQLTEIISVIRDISHTKTGYVAGNILNMLIELKNKERNSNPKLNNFNTRLKDYDFSHLTIRQAYLQEVELHNLNFSHSNLDTSVFANFFSSITSVTFSPDGKFLATGDTNAIIRLWNLNGVQPKLAANLLGHTGWIRSIDFSPDGKLLASCGADKKIWLWNIETRKCLKTLEGHEDIGRAVKFSPDGKTVASGSADKTIKLWNIETSECLETLKGHSDWVRSVAFSPDGKTLASGSQDKVVKVWDIESGKWIKDLCEHTDIVRTVAFSQDGETLASGSKDKTIKLWKIHTQESYKTLREHQDGIWSISFSSDGKLLVSSSDDKTIKLWDIKTNTGKCLKTLDDHKGGVHSVAFHPNRTILASGSDDKTIKLWDVEIGKCIHTLQGFSNCIRSISFSSDGKFLVSGGDDMAVRLWQIETRECIKIFKGHSNSVQSVAFSPNGKILASASKDSTIKLWHIETNKLIHNLKGHDDWVWSICFSPNEKFLASGSDDKTIKLWDVNSGQCIRTFKDKNSMNMIWSIAYSPNGKILASSGTDKTIKLWNVDSGQCIRNLDLDSKLIWTVVFSPDGKIIAGGSDYQTIKLWDVKTGECLQTLEEHRERIRSLAFSPDGKILASGSDDKTVKLWDWKNGNCIQTLEGHTSWVWSVAFSPDGHTLASGSQDETIKLWKVNKGDWIDDLIEVDDLIADKLYKDMDITNVQGLTDPQKVTLKELGAVDRDC